jgi:hypothetical protein
MRAIRISLVAAAFAISATGFSQNTKIVTKMCLDSIVHRYEKYAYSYDEQGRNTQTTRYNSVSSTWRPTDKNEYRYDAKDRVIIERAYRWVNSTEDWNNTSHYRTDYKYDDKGNLIEKTNGRVEGTIIYYDTKWEYEYDDKGNLIEELVYTYGQCEQGFCSWLLIYKHSEYMYGNKGNLIGYTKEDWRSKEEVFNPSQKYEYKYDVKGSLTEYISYEYKGNDWVVKEKYEYTAYDSIENNTKYVDILDKYEYDYEYTYNLSYSNADLVLPNKMDYQNKTGYIYNGMLTECKKYSRFINGGTRNLSTSETYYWSARETEIDDVSIVEAYRIRPIQIYPNPTTGQLKITNYELRDGTLNEVEVYDIYGRNVTPLTSHSSPLVLDISHLANGMYFLKIDNKIVKIIKN